MKTKIFSTIKMCLTARNLNLQQTKHMETIMSRIKIYSLLLALGFIVSACGGGNSSNTTPTPTLTSQQRLINEVYGLLGGSDDPPSVTPSEVRVSTDPNLPIIAHTIPSTVDEVDELNGSDATLPGKYYVVLSTEPYKIVDNSEQRNKLMNPTIEPNSNHSDLGKVELALDLEDGNELDVVLLFNNDANSAIALSSMGDFVAGGKPIVNMPTGPLTYSGVNYYKIATSSNQIRNGDFELSVNFSEETGTFSSGLEGEIVLESSTGNYTGRITQVADTSYENVAIKGKFHGNAENSSVTGLYHDESSRTPAVIGAIIGTSN